MDLLERVNAIPLFRPLGVPKSLRHACAIALNADLPKLPGLLAAHPQLSLERLIVPDLEGKLGPDAHLEAQGRKIPLLPLEELPLFPELEKIIILPDNPVMAALLVTRLAIFGANFQIRNFWLHGGAAPHCSLREARPGFLRQNMGRLEAAAKLFEDEASREAFAGRVKAIISGDAGFMPIAPHAEYWHPLVQPEAGDVMIDGGVSDMVGAQLGFLEAVGERGRIFGFEPIPGMAAKAARELKPHANYRLLPQGLAEKPGQAVFQDLRDSSHMIDGEGEGIRCELASVDAFMEESRLARLDCLKLDVEGAELSALKGAAKTIRKLRPRLIICLYHKPQDMWEIPEYIKSLGVGYRLWLAHSSCQFTDTILYAKAEE